MIPGLSDRYAMDTLIDQMQTAELLADCKRRYTGVARLGIEALELKIHGYSGADIARLYDVKPNHVGAWISRAAQKMVRGLVSAGTGDTDFERFTISWAGCTLSRCQRVCPCASLPF